MTDKELAKEIVKRNVCGDCNKCQSHGYIGCDTYRYSRDSFLAGFRAARQWHDLEKNPTDLPEDRRNVYVVYLNDENFYDLTIAAYRYKHWCIDGHKTDYEIVAWYELPTWGK